MGSVVLDGPADGVGVPVVGAVVGADRDVVAGVGQDAYPGVSGGADVVAVVGVPGEERGGVRAESL